MTANETRAIFSRCKFSQMMNLKFQQNFFFKFKSSCLLSERGYVNIYDSMYDSVDEDTLNSLKFLYNMIHMSEVQKTMWR